MRIPRLEMLAILIGIRAIKFVKQQLELNACPEGSLVEPKCPLYWIQNHSKPLSRFVRNRIGEIREAKFSFRYIPGKHNLVDVATKGQQACIHEVSNVSYDRHEVQTFALIPCTIVEE
uniref:Reverse transcriptase n=1 Tax=Loa loa TaxID=7209 RepID=A0A1I7VVC9_LOALO